MFNNRPPSAHFKEIHRIDVREGIRLGFKELRDSGTISSFFLVWGTESII